jgi:hypothetical protein
VALSDFFSPLLTPIVDAIKSALGPFGKLFDLITNFWTHFTGSLSKARELGSTIYSEVIAWKNFKEDINFRTGVINLPKAIEKTREFIDQLIAAWHAVVDLVHSIKENLDAAGEDDPAVEAKAAVEDIEASGFKSLLTQFPKLAKGLEKLSVAVAALAQIAENVENLIDDLTEIVDACVAIREEVEHASTIFLQQKNPRRSVKLEEGGSIKIRVGNLHG